MNFNSMIFIWVFLPVTLAVNFLLTLIKFKSEKTRFAVKNIVLLIASLVFYAFGGLNYFYVIIVSILLNFFAALIMEKVGKTGAKRAVFIIALLCNVAILGFFKYFNSVIATIEALMHTENGFFEVFRNVISAKGTGELNIISIALPLGISFFTFHCISYLADVYNGKARVQRNIMNFALYVAMFPKLTFGPIMQYREIEDQLTLRRESLSLFADGQKKFCYGLAKKVIIADTLAKVVNQIWKLESNQLGTLVAWFGIISYTLQIYYDFSGCSDMAIGLGEMFGFKFKKNFDYPYTSLSIQEFWRRWHISLSDWFKEYIYIPLGGSRKGAWRTYFNVFVVFLVTGIWHGENFRFVVWGLFYAVLQIIERLFLRKLLDKNPVKVINWVYVMLSVMIGWVYFRSSDIFAANAYLARMFTINASPAQASIFSYLSMRVCIAFIVGILLCGFIQRPLKKLYEKIRYKIPFTVADYAWQLCLFVYSVCTVAIEGGTPALYGGF